MRQIDGTEALARVRGLRRKATEAERLLWSRLRNRQLAGFKFRRQMWIGAFIADFVCMERRLVVEVDGSHHAEDVEYDGARSALIGRKGYRVIRFWNNEVTRQLETVLEAILAELVPSPSHPPAAGGPLPLPERERGL